MPLEPFSDLPIATICTNADLIVALQAGVNVTIPRSLLLTSGPSEVVTIASSSGSLLTFKLDTTIVATTTEFSVSGNLSILGNISQIRSIPYVWPGSPAAGCLTNDGSGNLSWTPAAGGVAVGSAIGGSVARSVLFVDALGDLASSSDFLYAPGSGLRIFNGPIIANLAGPGGAGVFNDPTHVVSICDGTNNVSYAPGAPGDWAAAAPTDVWLAIDRLLAWLLTQTGILGNP